jgi:hypothetical protein
MSWFQRHLNWSLFLGAYLFPAVVNITLAIIFFVVVFGGIPAFSELTSGTTLAKALPFIITYIVVELVLLALIIFVIWWYLGQKARSKWFILLFLAPGIIAGLVRGGLIGEVLDVVSSIAGIVITIILFRLENHRMDYGVDFAGEPVPDQWLESGQLSTYDDRQLKELDYTPAKNVLDMVESGDVKDIPDVSAAGLASEEAPAPEKVMERAVSQERLKPPILLDDAGAAIRCFYHPGADAVNLCSRCQQYVCSECNYITGTHPICRNCWEKRAEVPVAPPPQKQVSPVGKPQKQKVVESAEPVEQKDVGITKPEKQKITASVKSGKLEAEKNEWLPEFMALYEQASHIINVVTSKSTDGTPASPLDLMEGLKLRPMLERAKKLSKPKDKELRQAKNEFEQVLSRCIKIADAAADFVSGGGQALLGGPDFARIVEGIESANGLMQKLSSRLVSFSHPRE